MDSEEQRTEAAKLRAELLADVRAFFEEHMAGGRDAPAAEREVQLATAALLVEMTRADLEIDDDERRAVQRGIEAALELPPGRTEQILGLAEQQVRLGTPLHEFARLIDERYSAERKKHVVELMWRVAFADAELKAHEEYLVRKVAELLHVSRGDFIAAKIAARERFFDRGVR